MKLKTLQDQISVWSAVGHIEDPDEVGKNNSLQL
jgi:hypothetical protein